jgi:dethiobiotin synthetase
MGAIRPWFICFPPYCPTNMPTGLFITGTSTEVGKTYVAALIARNLFQAGRQVGVYKPAASGCRREGDRLIADDALALWEAAGRPLDLAAVCPQCFEAPLAPHLAAAAEGRAIDRQLLREGLAAWAAFEVVIVEGAGGLLSPISDDDLVADLAVAFQLPVVVVADNCLGVINQTLLTIEACQQRGLRVPAVVLNDARPQASDISQRRNLAELRRWLPAETVLAHLAHGADSFDRPVDWYTLACR